MPAVLEPDDQFIAALYPRWSRPLLEPADRLLLGDVFQHLLSYRI
jgi:hypothetical protein